MINPHFMPPPPGLVDRFHDHGFTCLIWANSYRADVEPFARTSHLCGYLIVPEGHPWDGLHYDWINDMLGEAAPHGGLTHAARVVTEETDTTQLSPSVRPEVVEVFGDLAGRWCVGFNCAHAGDLVLRPSMPRDRGDVWRDENFVREQLRDLATWAADLDGPP